MTLFERFCNYFIKQVENSNKVKIYFKDIDDIYGTDLNIICNGKKWKLHFTKGNEEKGNIAIISTEWYMTEIITTKNFNEECRALQNYIMKNSL